MAKLNLLADLSESERQVLRQPYIFIKRFMPMY